MKLAIFLKLFIRKIVVTMFIASFAIVLDIKIFVK